MFIARTVDSIDAVNSQRNIMLRNIKKLFNLDYTILRFGSLYGPRANATNGIYRIVKHAIEKGFVIKEVQQHRESIFMYKMQQELV